MQAILLCEYYARFRGRKVVVTASKVFREIYTRVSINFLPFFFFFFLGFHTFNPQEPFSYVPDISSSSSLDDTSCQTCRVPSYYSSFLSRQWPSIYSVLSSPQVVRNSQTTNAPYTSADNGTTSQAQRWRQWLDTEARRRLHAACFLLDVNTSVLYEQPLLKPITPTSQPVPLTGQTCKQWAATTADDWEMAAMSADLSMPLVFSPGVDVVTADRLSRAPVLDIAVYLAGEVLRVLPRGGREEFGQPAYADLTASDELQRLFSWSPMANTYTALSYTPLHDILAVSGDSWIFAAKVLTTERYNEHKARLQLWCQSRQAWAAAKFAAKALCSFLALGDDGKSPINPQTTRTGHLFNANAFCPDTLGSAELAAGGSQGQATQPPNLARIFDGVINYKISDYWAAYACALICWAVCYQAELTAMTTSYNRNSQGPYNIVGQQQPQKWLQQAASAPLDMLLCLPSAGVASGIVGLTRKRLQFEAIGGTNGLLNDALDVLRKLEDRGSAAFWGTQ